MYDYTKMREKDLMHPDVLYKAYKDYMYMYKTLKNFREEYKYAIPREEMRNRIQYILKNKIKQRDEISTLYWILGEEDVRYRKE